MDKISSIRMEETSRTADSRQVDGNASPIIEAVGTEIISENRNIVKKTTTLPITNITSVKGLNSIQDLYPNSLEDPDLNILVRDPSVKRNRVNKQAYMKLHRSSFNNNRSSVDVLKGKYENRLQIENSQAENNVRSSENENNAVHNNNINGNINKETENNNTDIDFEYVELRKKPVTEDLVSHIEQLQSRLSTKLDKDTVESLKHKYSPASFGYPKVNDASSTENSLKRRSRSTEKPPVPRRISSILTEPSIVNHRPRGTALNVRPQTYLETSKEINKLNSTRPANNTAESFGKVNSDNLDFPHPEEKSKVNHSPRGIPLYLRPKTYLETQPKKVSKLHSTRPASNTARNFGKVNCDNVEFAQPEEKFFVVRQSSSEDSIEQIENFLSDFTMEKKKPKEIKEKKRSSSFRKILTGSFFGKDKKKHETDKKVELDKNGDGDKKITKKTENAVFSDNFQNEHAFNRNSTHRHTVDFPKSEHKDKNKPEVPPKYRDDTTVSNLSGVERRYAELHINQFNQIKANFSHPESFRKSPAEHYVPMDGSNENKLKDNLSNTSNVDKYIDTSSSSNTLDSDNRGTYENALIAQAEMRQLRELEIQRQAQNKLSSEIETNAAALRRRNGKSPERFSETPPRAQEIHQNLQLIKPKALIPINSERPLPNPYHNDQEGTKQESGNSQAKIIERNLNVDRKAYPTKPTLYSQQGFDNIYGTVYDRKLVAAKQQLSPQNQERYSPNQTRSSNSSSFSNSPSSPNFAIRSSPKSPTLENSKLRLPPNREKVNLQPRIKSPIPQPKVSTDKIIATELLKNKSESKKAERLPSPSQLRLQVNANNPENIFSERKQANVERSNNNSDRFQPLKHFSNANTPQQRQSFHDINSSADAFEAARWQQAQRELAKSPSLQTEVSLQVTTNAAVDMDSPISRNSRQYGSLPPISRSRPITRDVAPMQQRSVTPVRRIPSTTSLQVSPQKHEIRQSVQIYCWKELQKLKEKQDQELQYQMQYTPYGYVEDPIIVRRSRSTEQNQQRNGRRSASLPRESVPTQVDRSITGRNYHREVIPENKPIVYGEDDIYAQKNPNYIRGSPRRRPISGGMHQNNSATNFQGYYSNVNIPPRPIFNRGSLNPEVPLQVQEQLNKKVSFSSLQNQENLQSWPTKNGYVQSPPQRRVDKEFSVSDDDVFFPNKENNVNVKPNEVGYDIKPQRQGLQDYVVPPENRTNTQKSSEFLMESPYGSRQMLMLPRQGVISNELIYTARQQENIRNAQTQKKNETNDGRLNKQQDYGTMQNQQSIGQDQRIPQEYHYSINDQSLNESPYGTRSTQQIDARVLYSGTQQSPNESSYGRRQNSELLNELPYGTNRSLKGSPNPQKDVINQSLRITRQNQQVLNESPYGTRQNTTTVESPYGTRGSQQMLTQPVYGSQQQISIESPYGTRHISQVARDSPYSIRDNRQHLPEPIYEIRNNSRLQNESPYGTRPSAVQNIAVNESPYGSRPSIQNTINPLYASRQSVVDNTYARTPQPLKQVTVSDKVCDMYGQIHDTGSRKPVSPTSYGEVQQSGVLYGQLQPSNQVLDKPPQHQSYSPMPSNFVRGNRLTASANDMHRRYPVHPRYRTEQVVYRHQITEFDPDAPLPPVPNDNRTKFIMRRTGARPHQPISDTESDTSEVRRIMNRNYVAEEEWNSDGKSGRGIPGSESGSARGENDTEIRGRSRNARRDDPRRHTLAGDQQYGSMDRQGGPLSRTMDLEGQPRGYPPPTNPMLFDDDPGIMSEVETSSTGFRRGGKQRSSLPVVRTPSKTLERPLGLVFLQYRNETKRALLPNEITSIDTVKALFVRSFPKQLTMEYLDSPQVKIYIHDSSKDMFYELEDLRSHLREIRDRSVLRLFESADVSGGLPMAGIGIAGGVGHFEDPSYFSEPEFDSEYQHQHIHKSKGSAGKGAPYYMGSTASLPRSGLLRAYSPAVTAIPPERLKALPTGAPPKPQRAYASGTRSSEGPSRPPDRFAPFQRPANSLFTIPDGYMSSPERGSRYEDPYYSQYTTRSGSITPVIDEEISDTELLDESYSLYGVKLPTAGPRTASRTGFPPPAAVPYDTTRIRVENMERQLANLTGLVQKALTQTPATLQVPGGRDNYRTGEEFDKNSTSSSASLPDKSVSFEKSVSFSDEPPDMNSPKQHSPQHTADTKPPKPAIKSSTLPRTSSQERDRLKPAPPPKPASLSPGQYDSRHIYRDLQLTPEMYNQLRGLQKKAKDLRAEVRNLRRMSQAQAHSVRETIRDTFIKIRAMLLAGGEQVWQAGMDQERVRLSREEDLYKQEMLRLEKDLTELESTVEELRGNVINRKTRVNMSDVENMALILSKSSKTVADLKLRFPSLQDSMKSFLSSEMEKVVREEKFLKEEPERLESALRRCKKLTGTLVTLKRLASVQEQRLPCSTAANDGRLSPGITDTPPVTPTSAQHSKPTPTPRVGQIIVGGDSANSSDSSQRPENALDALLDELQTFSKPHPSTVSTQMPQVTYPESEPPTLPIKGIPPSHSSHFSHPPSMSEIGRKGSMDSATILPTQNLTVSTATGSLRRLHSYPSGSDTDNSPPIQPLHRVQVDNKTASGKPPLPERNTELLQHISGKRIPPPPPPRTSSKSPLASPTSPSLPPRSPATGLQHIQNVQNMVDKPQSQFEVATQNLGLSTLRRNAANRSSLKDRAQTLPRNIGSNLQVQPDVENAISASNSSSCESVNSQDGTKKRKEELELRHQELLKKQKALQEQYARLQQLQRGNNTLAVIPPPPDQLLKKTGSESNLLQKMGLQMSAPQMTGSLTNLPNSGSSSNKVVTTSSSTNTQNSSTTGDDSTASSTSSTTTSKVYETDIL